MVRWDPAAIRLSRAFALVLARPSCCADARQPLDGRRAAEGPCPPRDGMGWRFWPEQLLPSSAFLPTRGRLRAQLTAARRLAAVARATDPQADGPGFFESTSTSCVPLYATEPADEQADELACHARRIREECGKRKAIAQLFSRATCLELDRTTAAFSFGFKAASHRHFVASS